MRRLFRRKGAALADALDGRGAGNLTASERVELEALEAVANRLEAMPAATWSDPPEPPPPPAGFAAAPPRNAHGGLTLRPAFALATALALVGAGVLGGRALSGGEDTDRSATLPPSRVTLEALPAVSGTTGVARLDDHAGGRVTVRVSGARPSGGASFYELWLMNPDGAAVSLGSFRVPASGSGVIRARLPVDPARYRYLDVSREPADGDPAHSAVSVLRGPVA